MSKVYFEKEDSPPEVQKKMDDYIEKNRQEESNNKTDKIISTLCGMTFLMRMGISLLKWLDKHGLLPKSIIDASPFHCTATVTNLASIRTNHIYHHVYNFGTTTLIMAMGNAREVPTRKHGEIEFVRCMPVGVVMDERICNGSQYAMAFRRFSYYLKNPALLDVPPETVADDLP